MIKRSFSLFIKTRGTPTPFTYECYAKKLRDRSLDFPHGKRNKIILAARELDRLIEIKLDERDRQEEVISRIAELEKVKNRDKGQEAQLQELEQKKEIVSANGCILLYRSML